METLLKCTKKVFLYFRQIQQKSHARSTSINNPRETAIHQYKPFLLRKQFKPDEAGIGVNRVRATSATLGGRSDARYCI